MRSTVEVIRTGILSNNLHGDLSILQCYVSIEELMNSLPHDHLLLDRFASSYERSVNKEKLLQLEDYFFKSILNGNQFVSPQVTLYVYGHIPCKQVHDKLITLQYNQNKSVILEGYLLISALSNLLGRVDPFTGKQPKHKALSDQQKQTLASLDVRLSIYYSVDEKINEETLSKLFFDINRLDYRVYSQYIATHDQESPLHAGVEKLIESLELNSFGGVSELNKITKSDSFVTTKSTLINILLASMIGKGARIEKQLPTHLPDKTVITTQLVDIALETIVPLMSGWLSCLESSFKRDFNGFHRSMQIWQAIGVVAFHLSLRSDLTKDKIYDAGRILGELDYSKTASHWGCCKAFKKDANDKFWINATGGGRTLRNEVAEYFITILKQVV
ncbi:TPA: hypothetical protein ACMDX1_003717 [Vibrio parahaemolyticus]|uniref:hypothetical protein n=1 Tax=Vibrio parahaemolyticus TaxID=670 RepID=UPI0006A57DD7|nr:hypothetical protein [Vibrio parahaemolyticus]EGQ7684916.1 hypothetical protein [Vibrio parahaemolyticus]EGQ7836103.1 hypothetical protein [Vibrio parahaemolyticus]EGQ8183910.1 hypothetical protein [Vibrio parahaemolyticus]EGQ8546511.1 hypothetical protein [Vibrio parahaemolyticus]EJD0681919.1 hypothetical protein [Vibrio parahaemolyticus]